MRILSAADAASAVRSEQRVFIHSVAAAPQQLIAALTARAPELRDVELVHLHTEGPAPYAEPSLRESFRTNDYLVDGVSIMLPESSEKIRAKVCLV